MCVCVLSPDGSEFYVYQSGARGCKLCNRGKERVAGTVTGVCAPSAGPPVTFEETSMEEITTLSRSAATASARSTRRTTPPRPTRSRAPLVLRGASLLVNAKCAEGGYVRAALLGATEAAAVAGSSAATSRCPSPATHSRANCAGAAARACAVGGQAVRIAKNLRRCDLYSFWVQ